jgi:formylglycine-generating enzyme required for sulfatase activity
VSRLFLSHSSKDNVAAIAFKQWLGKNGWPEDDVFLDLQNIGAGERWKDALRKANARCEAIILLVSPESLSSPECLAEVRKAEDYGKEIVVVLLRDIKFEDPRLDSYKERQIVDLSAPPQSHLEKVDYRGEHLEIKFNADALASVKEFLFKRGITPDHFAWPPEDRPEAMPFPGLSAFTEGDAGIFFGRDADIVRGLDKLRILRRDGRPRLLVIQASSGAGKSSFLRAGLWPRLDRDPDFAPLCIVRPAQGILTGPEGLGRKLAARLSRPGSPVNAGDIHAQLMSGDPAKAAASFVQVMQLAAGQALEERRIGDQDARAPALLLAIDQAEELLASDDAEESQRALFLLAKLMQDPPEGVDPFALLTIRSDNAARLFQAVAEAGLEAPETLQLLPLPQTSYREIILKPLEVIGRRGQVLTIDPALTEQLAKDATGADALPLLAFTLSNLYQEYSASGNLTSQQYDTMGGVAGSINMALKRALSKPTDAPAIPSAKDAQLAGLRAAFVPWLARIDPESGAAMRRVARLEEFAPSERAVVERLVEARLLVADRRSGADVVEIAHESLLRQWPPLTEWLKLDAENLKLLDAIERAASDWVQHDAAAAWLDHRGERLRAAELLATRADFRKRLGNDGLAYIAACRAREAAENKGKTRVRMLVGGLAAALILSVVGWKYQRTLQNEFYRVTTVTALGAERERTLKPHETFQECRDCPKMIVVPAGAFKMGSPDSDHIKGESPQHDVTIAQQFAVGIYEVTFREWDACATHGDCNPNIRAGDERLNQPTVNVSWNDAQTYVAWLSKITGKAYRLLTEAQWEYAARATKPTYYSFGNDDGMLDQYAWYAANSGAQTHEVGQKKPNLFGLYDVHGNVSEWVEDCHHDGYQGAPVDGSAWRAEDNCIRRVIRGGSWLYGAKPLRSASRNWQAPDTGKDDIGFRIARVLAP